MFEKYKRVLLGVLVVAGILIFSICNSIRIDNINKSLRTDLAEANKKIAELELKFETFKSLTSSEFESTWKSFAIVRGNFLAIGHGLHLSEEDICPESEPECRYKNLKEEM